MESQKDRRFVTCNSKSMKCTKSKDSIQNSNISYLSTIKVLIVWKNIYNPEKRRNKMRIERFVLKRDLNPDVEVIRVKVMQSDVSIFTSTRETVGETKLTTSATETKRTKKRITVWRLYQSMNQIMLYLFPSGLNAKAFIGPKWPFTPPISSCRIYILFITKHTVIYLHVHGCNFQVRKHLIISLTLS